MVFNDRQDGGIAWEALKNVMNCIYKNSEKPKRCVYQYYLDGYLICIFTNKHFHNHMSSAKG